MSNAHKYISYTMDASGFIVRKHRTFTLSMSDTADYPLRETLRGWPESVVYWRVMGDLSRVGIAPLSPAATKAMLQHGFCSIDALNQRRVDYTPHPDSQNIF
jgi:hypothetical protein